MNYYPFHIGDFRSGTMHLSNSEDLAYRRLLDWYYDTEKPIPVETQWVSRRLRVETQDLETVLKDFFVLTEQGWRHDRCEAEIAEYRARVEKNKENGKKGGRPKKPKANQDKPSGFPDGSHSDGDGMPVETDSKGNQEPRTNNQEPINKTPLTPLEQNDDGDDLPALAPAGEERRKTLRDPDELPEPHQLGRNAATGAHPDAGNACAAMKKTGVGLMNPSHPKLNALLHAGVTIDELVCACEVAVKNGKTFAYAMAVAESQAAQAREVAEKLGAPPAEKGPSRYSPDAYKDFPPVSTL